LQAVPKTGGVDDLVASNLGEISSMEEFHALRNLDPGSLTPGQLNRMKAIRNAIPDPVDGEMLQKVISETEIDQYLDGVYDNVQGFISKQADVANLATKDDIIEGLRLDPWSNYTDADAVGVIEFPKSADFDVHKAYGKNVYPDAFLDPTDYGYPFSGYAFTTTRNGKVIPEYHLGVKPDGELKGVAIRDGCTMHRVDNVTGKQLVATFIDGQWVPYVPTP